MKLLVSRIVVKAVTGRRTALVEWVYGILLFRCLDFYFEARFVSIFYLSCRLRKPSNFRSKGHRERIGLATRCSSFGRSSYQNLPVYAVSFGLHSLRASLLSQF